MIFVLKLSTSDGNRGIRPASGYPLMMMMNWWWWWLIFLLITCSFPVMLWHM